MGRSKQEGLLIPKRKGRVWPNPRLTGELAVYLMVHVVQCQRASAKIRRMRKVLEDGTETSNSKYYDHAAGYLSMMLSHLHHSYSPEDVETAIRVLQAQEQQQTAADADPETPPLPGM